MIDIVKGEFYENTSKKNFTTSEKVEITEAVKPYFKEKAKERKKESGKKYRRGRPKRSRKLLRNLLNVSVLSVDANRKTLGNLTELH